MGFLYNRPLLQELDQQLVHQAPRQGLNHKSYTLDRQSLHHRRIDDASNFLDWKIDVDRVIVGKLYDAVRLAPIR